MKIVQVYKTDVREEVIAARIVAAIQNSFSYCKVNFDLEDADRILRIECCQGVVDESAVERVLAMHGHRGEVLSD